MEHKKLKAQSNRNPGQSCSLHPGLLPYGLIIILSDNKALREIGCDTLRGIQDTDIPD